MEKIERCNLCGIIFPDPLQLLRAAMVIKHYEISHPGEDPTNIGNNPDMNRVMDQPTDQLKVS